MDGRTAAVALGVGPQATRDEIRRAFRARVKRVHPDVAGLGEGESNDAFLTLRAAFDHLVTTAPEVGPNPPPRTVADPGPWGQGMAAARRVSVIDVADVQRPAPARTPAPRRARTFDDHLADALAALG